MGWLLAQPAVVTVMAGAAEPGQASRKADASAWRLSPDEAEEAIQILLAAA